MRTIDELLSASWQPENGPTSRLAPIATMQAPQLVFQSGSLADSCSEHIESDGRWDIRGSICSTTEEGTLNLSWGSASELTARLRGNSVIGEHEANHDFSRRSSTKNLPIEFIVAGLPNADADRTARRIIKSHTTRHYHHHKRMRQQKIERQQTTSNSVKGVSKSPEISSEPAMVNYTSRTRGSCSFDHLVTPLESGTELLDSSLSRGQNAEYRCANCGTVTILSYKHSASLSPSLMQSIDGSFSNSTPYLQVAIDHEMHENLVYWCEQFYPRTNPAIYGCSKARSCAIRPVLDMAISDLACLYAVVALAIMHRHIAKQGGISSHQSLQQLTTSDKAVDTALRLFSTTTRLLQNRLNCLKDALSVQSITATLLLYSFMIESMTASTTSSRTRLQMYSSQHKDPAQRLGSPFHKPNLEQFLWKSLFDCACDLHYLTYYLDLHKINPNRIGPKEVEFLEDTFAAVQHELAMFPRPDSIFTRSYVYYRQNCWRMAAILYVNTFVRTCPSLTVLRYFVEDLLQSLPETDMKSSWDPAWHVLMWCLYLGYCASEKLESLGWFYYEIRRLCGVKRVESFEGFEHILLEGPYSYRLGGYRELGRWLFENLQ